MGRTKGSKADGWISHRKRRREIVEPGPGGKTTITEHLVPIHPVQQHAANMIPQLAEMTMPENSLPNDEPSLPGQNKAQNRTYQSRKKSESSGWVEAQPKLKEAYLQSMAPLHRTCRYCPFIKKPEDSPKMGEDLPKNTDNIILCQDCGPAAYFCNKCFHVIHQFSPLHTPLIWLGTIYIPYVWDKHLVLPAHGHHATSPSNMTVIDHYGRQHTVNIRFCDCMTKGAALIQLGLWPATSKSPVTAIDLRFMELCRCMLLGGAVAIYKFASIMKKYSDQLPHGPEKVNMYNAIAMDTTAYHRRFAYDITYLQGIVPNFPDGSSCPVCIETQSILPKVVSMDGNFRLVRKKSAGMSIQKPHHQGQFFLDLEEVAPFLKAPTCAHDVDCSDFKAGTPSRAAFKAAKLDVTGVFGSICVHDYPQLFINMNSGEKLGYAVCVIEKLLQENKNVKVLYDVACRLLPQLQGAGVTISSEDLAVPIFHGYAHNAKCQMEYNPRNKYDFRLADGENTERLWSDLTHFVYITKEMAPSNRHDLLVDALLHWAEKAMKFLGLKIKMRLKNAHELKEKSRIDLDKILQPLQDQGIDVSDHAIDDWNLRLRNEYARIRKKIVSTWQMNYAVLLKKWYSLKWRVAGVAIESHEVEAQAELESLQEKLLKTEKAKGLERWTQESGNFKKYLKEASEATRAEIVAKMHQEAVDRTQLILLKKRERGNDAISRVMPQIQKTNLKLKTLLRHHNAIDGVTERSFDEVKDPGAELYNALPSIMSNVPFPILRDAIRLKNTIDRVEEEVEALRIELLAALHGYEKQNIVLQEALEEINNPAETHQGVCATIIKKIIENEKHIVSLALESKRSFNLEMAIETPFFDRIPTEFLPNTTMIEGETGVDEPQEEDKQDVDVSQEEYEDHPSDDEVATDDEL